MPDTTKDPLCPRCHTPVSPSQKYCINCGLPLGSWNDRGAIDSYTEAKVDSAVAERLAGQDWVIRALADQAEDLLWSRIKRYAWILALFGFLLGAYGITTLRDARNEIASEAHKRLDPVISGTETRMRQVEFDSITAQERINKVKIQLDGTAAMAEQQRERITAQSGEVQKKLTEVEAASARAQQLGTRYEEQTTRLSQEIERIHESTEAESKRLEAEERSLDTRIVQVSRQIDDVSVQRAYPTLGQQLYVTFNGKPWKGKSAKHAGEKWAQIMLDPMAIGENRVSQAQLDDLAGSLKKLGITPFFGFSGVDGPVGTGGSTFGLSFTHVAYFDRGMEQAAKQVVHIAAKTLNVPEISDHFVDPAGQDKVNRFVIENSGFDFQIFISHEPGK